MLLEVEVNAGPKQVEHGTATARLTSKTFVKTTGEIEAADEAGLSEEVIDGGGSRQRCGQDQDGASDGRQNDERKRKEAAVAIVFDFVVVFVVLRRCFGIMRSMVRDVELFGTKTFCETGQSERDPHCSFPFFCLRWPPGAPAASSSLCSMYGGRDCFPRSQPLGAFRFEKQLRNLLRNRRLVPF